MIDPKTIKIPTEPLDVSKLYEKDNVVPIRKVSVSLEGKIRSRVDRLKYKGNGHWKFPEDLNSKDYVGFIYCIRDMETNQCYIGKKQYKGTGKLNKGQESNWPWYISSCKALSESIKSKGKEFFEFIVLEQYKTKGGFSFAETWSLCTAEISYTDGKWYNTLINKVSWPVKEKITDRHKERLLKVIKDEVIDE